MQDDVLREREPLEYRVNAWKAMLGVIVPLPILAGIVWLTFVTPSYNSYTNARGQVLVFIGVPIYLFCAARLLCHLVFRQPVLTVSHAGIDLHRFWAGKGPIPWSEIRSVSARHYGRAGALVISLRHSAAIEPRRRGAAKIVGKMASFASVRDDVHVCSDLFLSVTADRIRSEIRRSFAPEVYGNHVSVPSEAWQPRMHRVRHRA
jgi:hypothetical protein